VSETDIEQFDMERMQCLYEHSVEFNLSESGVRPLSVGELLAHDPAFDLPGERLGYPESAGSDELRDGIATWYPDATRGNVTATTGGAEANFLSLWSLLEPGDRLAFMTPNYMQGFGLGRHFGAGTDTFSLRVEATDAGPRWALDLDELDRAVTPATKVVMVCSPNNPTGAVLTQAEVEAILAAAERAGAWVVSDEIYRGAEPGGRTTPTLWGRSERVIVTSGLSKAFGLPGLRLGWAVAPPEIIERLWVHRDYTTLMVSRLSDRLGTIAVRPDVRERIHERTRGLIREHLPIVRDWAASRGGLVSFVPPEGGAIVYVDYDLPIESTELIERLRVERSVLLVAGDQVGLGRGFRVGIGYDPGELAEGLELVGEVLDELRRG
jgi:aspartate/methionine/tyrosine aminotransferase